MRKTMLPTEFLSLSSKVNYVQQWTKDEWSSSCPQCGGTPHQDGSFPDRFRMWTNATGKNKVMGWCRHCGYAWFPDSDRQPSREDIEAWKKEQLAREYQRKAEAERAIELLKSQKIWEQYHANLAQFALARQTIEEWGIPKDFADAWQLGFIPDYTVYSKQNGEYHSPAITIPVWQPKWEIANVKVRVLNPKSPHDRYRKIYKTGQDAAFWTYPDLVSDTCLVVEGEKKAMVCSAHRPPEMQVVGVPTKMPSPELLSAFSKFKNIIVCLDPDASQDGSLGKMVKTLGKFRTTVIELPDKVDDMIVHHSLDLIDALRYAKKLEVK